MKTASFIAILLAVPLTFSTAEARHRHHKIHTIVERLGHGLLHILQNKEPRPYGDLSDDNPYVEERSVQRPQHHHSRHYERHIARTPTEAPIKHSHESLGKVAGMDSGFISKLASAFAALVEGNCVVGSGYRSHSQQAALHRAKPGLAAQPGHSNHERGLAADLSCSGGGLHWMHVHAAEYGLAFPMPWEPWHCEPRGLTQFASRHRHYARRHWHRRFATAG